MTKTYSTWDWTGIARINCELAGIEKLYEFHYLNFCFFFQSMFDHILHWAVLIFFSFEPFCTFVFPHLLIRIFFKKNIKNTGSILFWQPQMPELFLSSVKDTAKNRYEKPIIFWLNHAEESVHKNVRMSAHELLPYSSCAKN